MTPAAMGCMCVSMNPGSTVAPSRSTTSVFGPTSGSASARLPTEMTRPRHEASASAGGSSGDAGSRVWKVALMNRRSAMGMADTYFRFLARRRSM